MFEFVTVGFFNANPLKHEIKSKSCDYSDTHMIELTVSNGKQQIPLFSIEK